jgi:hypothetical protein
MEIKWKQGARFKVDPSIARDCLEEIRTKKGAITAGDVVAEAKRKTSPIHSEFEWDDKKAAHEHRKERARCMIRSLVVIRDKAPNVESRQYEVSVRTNKEPGEPAPEKVYLTTEQILQDPIQREKLLGRALAEIAAMRQRYAGLSELAVVFKAIDNLLDVA